MNPIEIFSQEELLMQTLTDLIRNIVAEEAETYNVMLAEYLTDLVKERLVKLGEAEMGLMARGGPLGQAYREVVYRLQERLTPYKIQFGFKRYQETVCEPLKALSREVALLQTALRESRRQDRVLFKTPIEVGEQVAFQIFAVGSAVDGETEALVAMPTSQQCSLDFHQVREECDVDGFWFPFQLSYRDPEMGELSFVVDQDGSVGIYTNNFPETLLRRVRKILKAIAGKLYCRDTSDSSSQVTDQSF